MFCPFPFLNFTPTHLAIHHNLIIHFFHMFVYFLWGYGGDEGWADPSSKDICYWYIPHLRCLPPKKKKSEKQTKMPTPLGMAYLTFGANCFAKRPRQKSAFQPLIFPKALRSPRVSADESIFRAQGVENKIHHLQALNRFWEVRWVANIRWTCVLLIFLDVLRSYGYFF